MGALMENSGGVMSNVTFDMVSDVAIFVALSTPSIKIE